MLRIALCLLLLCPPLALCAATDSKPAPAPVQAAVSLDDIRMFTAVFNLVRQTYVDPVDNKTMMQNASRGLLAGLDPHSEYLDESLMQSL